MTQSEFIQQYLNQGMVAINPALYEYNIPAGDLLLNLMG